jgi:uncharacterized membrane protein
MRTPAVFALATFAFALTSFAAPAPARADLRFCNGSAYPSTIQVGHMTEDDGFEVRGQYTIPNGTCSVILPYALHADHYYIRVVWHGKYFGSKYRFCVSDAPQFTIAHQDAPNFRCKGTGDHYIGLFMRIASSGHETMIVTQDPEENHFRFVVK